jgi:hypothetical protein
MQICDDRSIDVERSLEAQTNAFMPLASVKECHDVSES